MREIENNLSESTQSLKENFEQRENTSVGRHLFDVIRQRIASVVDVLRDKKSSTPGTAEFSDIKPLLSRALRKLEAADIPQRTIGNIERSMEDSASSERLELDTPTDDNVLIVRENISHIVNLDCQTRKISTELRLVNPETGTELNLNTLLPPGYTFTPSALEVIRKGENGKLKRVRDEEITLEQYRDYRLKKDNFSFIPFVRKVYYGNLHNQGGVLSLFHEIAHVWQQKRRGESRHSFEELFNKIKDSLGKIAELTGAFESDKIEKKDYDERVNEQLEKLKELGVSIPSKDVQGETKDSKLSGNNLIIKVGKTGDAPWMPVRSETLERSLLLYEAEERDAWANAIRMIYLLRGLGFDPEPSLINVEAVRAQIQPCLASYQQRVGAASTHKRTPFTREIDK